MTMALLLTLLLPLAQDDPQVTYREGLFEEVDQGNLDKAAELYAKVLKSNAPDALKAKALLRTGFCHEKKGKKKEAEQAWRDVIERFPGAGEVVKQAQQRLNAQGSADGDAGLGMEGTIQNLILDLGAASAPRMAAIRRLVLIADPAVPYLRKALQHKDAKLVWGAAQVLHELDPKEDLYDPLMAAYVRHGDPTAADAGVLGSLLYRQEGLKERFLKDYPKVLKSSLIGRTAGSFSSKVHAAFPDILKEWLIVGPMPSDDAWAQAFAAWTRNTEKPDLVTVIERLPSEELWGWTKIMRMLSTVETASATPAFQDAALKALAAHPRPMEAFDQIVQYQGLLQVFKASDLVTRVIAAWFAKGDLRLRTHILEWPRRYGLSNNPNFSKELSDFSFRRLGDNTESWETRLAIEASGLSPQTPEHVRSLVAFGVTFVKEASENSELADRMYRVLASLISRIPADSKDLPVVLDAAFNYQVPIPKSLIESNRYEVVEAGLRVVMREGRDANANVKALQLIAASATPEQKVRLIHYLINVPSSTASHAYVSGLLALAPAAFESKWTELRNVYAKAPAMFQAEIATALAQGDPRFDDFMKDAARSPHVWVRNAAILHWKSRKDGEGVPHLLKALEDASPENRVNAIEALGEVRALDAVPALLKFLEGNASPFREPATEALKLIRAHFEERMEWKRWYDETKKALGK